MYNYQNQGGLNQTFGTFYATLINCNGAMQWHKLQVAEDILVWSNGFYNNLKYNLQGDQLVPFEIVLSLIEIATSITRINEYQNDERFVKAMAELQSAKVASDKLAGLFSRVPQDMAWQIGFNNYQPMLAFMANYHERIIAARIGYVQGAIDKANGKFINEVVLLRAAASEMRRIQEKPLGFFSNPADGQQAMEMIGYLRKSAEFYEKAADRLEEKRKEIEFITPYDRRVFIVHGHNHDILNELKLMLKTDFNIEPIVLIDSYDNGDTIIEKFEHYGRLCAFAFVIVTPDDWVGNKENKYFQARPNVLFELGWFCGRYGRQRVRMLKKRNTPLPSDLNGIISIEFDQNLQEVKAKIREDLENAKILSTPA